MSSDFLETLSRIGRFLRERTLGRSVVFLLAGALALQSMLNRQGRQDVVVVLFTWPSDGQMLPFTSYRSDRTDAKAR